MRFPGSFGSAYLYYVVPKVILFRTEHSRRTLVPKVDFISAPGASDGECLPHRADPIALVTNRCLFEFRRTGASRWQACIRAIRSTRSSRTPGFDFDVPTSCARDAGALARDTQAACARWSRQQLAEVYPQFTDAGVRHRHRLLSRAEKPRPSGHLTRGLVCRRAAAGRKHLTETEGKKSGENG